MRTRIASLSLLVAMSGALSTMSVVSSCSDDKVSYIYCGNENLPQAEVDPSGGMLQIPGLKEGEEVLVTIEDEGGGTKSLMRASVLGSLRLVSVRGGIEITDELLNFIREQSKGKTLTLVFLHIYVGDREVCQKICVVEIIGNNVSVESVSLDKNTLRIVRGEVVALTATVLPENVGNKNVSWKSTNPAVATVDQDGKVTGVVGGTCNVIVTTEEGAKTDTCIVNVDPNVLPGKFTVNANGKQVRFTRSNLYYSFYDVHFHFEGSQTDYPTEWGGENHAGHFFWINSSDYTSGVPEPHDAFMSGAVTQSTTDKFWCGNENPLTVDGTGGLYVLDSAEWAYLLNLTPNATRENRCKSPVLVNDKKCLIIAPDDFVGTLKGSYTLAEADSLGFVCLRAAGYRDNATQIMSGGDDGYYSTSTCSGTNSDNAWCVKFDGGGSLIVGEDTRSMGCSIRLVKDVETE